MYKFQNLRVYKIALDYADQIYQVSYLLPEEERFNIRSQMVRAATSVILNIAEGSTSQSNPEQARFVGPAIRSYMETVACLDLVEKRGYVVSESLENVRDLGHNLFTKLQAFRRALLR